MSLNLEKRLNPKVRKAPPPKAELVIFKTPYEEQKWRLEQIMKDPVRRCTYVHMHTRTHTYTHALVPPVPMLPIITTKKCTAPTPSVAPHLHTCPPPPTHTYAYTNTIPLPHSTLSVDFLLMPSRNTGQTCTHCPTAQGKSRSQAT